jgi:hypothetical protein
MTTHQLNRGHLTTSQVAAILDRRLRPEERGEAIAHLSSCLECRHELAEMEHAFAALGSARRPTRRWTMVVAGIAAAVVVAALPVLLLPRRASAPSPFVVATRTGGVPAVDATAPIEVITPAEGAEAPPRRELVWHARGAGASYLVTVQDTSGAVLWSSSLVDTSATIPSSVGLVRGNRYYWSVDARLGDGVSAKTGAHEFRVP